VQNENSLSAQIKSSSRLVYELAYRQALKAGFDEALLLNTLGHLCEGSRSNIFLVVGKTLFTPALSSGCVEGITRKVVLDLAHTHRIRCKEGKIPVETLLQADESFLTNSLRGIMPLESVDRHPIAGGHPGRITKFFMDAYQRLVQGEV
jgi:4-amino-4-deoxychorismate lyase